MLIYVQGIPKTDIISNAVRPVHKCGDYKIPYSL